MLSQDLDLCHLQDLPGFKPILKAILKGQIQHLVEQLSKFGGEESVLLSASLTEGTLCHLGSKAGANFLEDHSEIKSQFLGFCLKNLDDPDVVSCSETVTTGLSLSGKRQRSRGDGFPGSGGRQKDGRPGITVTSRDTAQGRKKKVVRISVKKPHNGASNEELAGIVSKMIAKKLATQETDSQQEDSSSEPVSDQQTRSLLNPEVLARLAKISGSKEMDLNTGVDYLESASSPAKKLRSVSEDSGSFLAGVAGVKGDFSAVTESERGWEASQETVASVSLSLSDGYGEGNLDMVGAIDPRAGAPGDSGATGTAGDDEGTISKALKAEFEKIDELALQCMDERSSKHQQPCQDTEIQVQQLDDGKDREIFTAWYNPPVTQSPTAATILPDVSAALLGEEECGPDDLGGAGPPTAVDDSHVESIYADTNSVAVDSEIKSSGKGFEDTCGQSPACGHLEVQLVGSVGQEESVQCYVCAQTFDRHKDYRAHLLTEHKDHKPFVCNVCGHKFRAKGAYKAHVIAVHTQKCSECGVYVTEADPWEVGVNRNDKRFIQCECKNILLFCSSLKGRRFRKIDEQETQQTYACSICDKLFLMRKDCEKHQLTHAKNELKCDLCDKVFTSQLYLEKHRKEHEQIIAYTCTICGKKFLKVSNFSSHVRTKHGIEQTLTCLKKS